MKIQSMNTNTSTHMNTTTCTDMSTFSFYFYSAEIFFPSENFFIIFYLFSMARTNYPYLNSSSQICCISTILVILNIDRPDADLQSIRRKIQQLLRKNNLRVCKTLKGSLNRLLTYYYRNNHALPSIQEITLY